MKEPEVRGLIQRRILKWIKALKDDTLTDEQELLVIQLGIWLLKDMDE